MRMLLLITLMVLYLPPRKQAESARCAKETYERSLSCHSRVLTLLSLSCAVTHAAWAPSVCLRTSLLQKPVATEVAAKTAKASFSLCSPPFSSLSLPACLPVFCLRRNALCHICTSHTKPNSRKRNSSHTKPHTIKSPIVRYGLHVL